MAVKSFKIEGLDDHFEVKKTGKYSNGTVISTGHKIEIGGAHLTATSARKLAAWLIKAADFCDLMNRKKFK